VAKSSSTPPKIADGKDANTVRLRLAMLNKPATTGFRG
jgi:hypothetical protein